MPEEPGGDRIDLGMGSPVTTSLGNLFLQIPVDDRPVHSLTRGKLQALPKQVKLRLVLRLLLPSTQQPSHK